MEFHEDYATMEEKANIFFQECIKQNLASKITYPFMTVFLNDHGPVWRVAFPVEKEVSIEKPLQMEDRGKLLVVQKKFLGYDNRSTIKTFIFQLQEMGFIQSYYTIVRWLGNTTRAHAEMEIIIPVLSIDSNQYIIASISRFTVTISVILFFLLSIFVLVYKRKKSHVLFALILFSLAMYRIDWIWGTYRYSLFIHFPHVFYMGDLFQYLLGPLLFFFMLSLLYKNFQFKIWHFIHLIPFIAASTIWSARYFRYSAEIKRTIILSGSIISDYEQSLGSMIVNAQMVGYVGAAVYMLYSYQREIKNQQANIQPKQFTWLYVVLLGFLTMKYIGILKHAVSSYFGSYSELLFILSVMSYLVFALILFYYLLKHPELFSLVEQKLEKSRKASLSEPVLKKYKEDLIGYMEAYKPYLIPDINLGKLSELTGIPSRSLSEVINNGFERNFFEFMNHYRIEEAKRLIMESRKNNKTILEILYEVGYNNKSVFNATFKKYTGETPTEYKMQSMDGSRSPARL